MMSPGRANRVILRRRKLRREKEEGLITHNGADTILNTLVISQWRMKDTDFIALCLPGGSLLVARSSAGKYYYAVE
jgi:hypothetical protein